MSQMRDMGHPVLWVVLLFLFWGTAFAGGPRWVTGAPYFSANGSGNAVVWGTTNLKYSTDPGNLSVYVNHAAADALVATAAASWNVSVSAMVVSQGGVLAEDVNGLNVYMGPGGPVFPAGVASVPVAVIYDSDGAVTDMLLGGGASDPGNCRQTAVTESVDGISAAGKITHALLILNGRCTGAAPEMQKEMTYRLVRAFGRILGVGWSQLNENVFTGVPQPTPAQALHWPVMHPIDVMCGPYAYQCLPQPYTLRPDDMATMVMLYPESGSDAGKTFSFQSAGAVTGTVSFPNGQGMAGVNLVEHRYNISQLVMDTFEETSAVSGYRFQRQGATVVAAKGTGSDASQGYLYSPYEGRYDFPWIPLEQTWFENVYVTMEPINPLYVGQYAVGPYGGLAQVVPSGTVVNAVTTIGSSMYAMGLDLSVPDAVSTCTASGDGTAAAPVSVAASGMWQGAMCGYAHTAWVKVAVKAGRTLTVEVTALDEQGLATGGKMQPVIGVWASTDKTGTLPTVASAATPLNTITLGMTAVTVSNASARTLRVGVGDARGDGRPDYGYRARVLYADGVSPATVPQSGGVITITGMGFKNGNAVTVNGVAAAVTSWSANAIVAVAPAMTGTFAGNTAADVVVTDLSTGGTTTIARGIAYTGAVQPHLVSVVSVPADGSLLGVAAATVFGVKVRLADGVSPAAGVGVVVSATNGAGLVGCGGAGSCTLTTDAAGMVGTEVVPSVAGTVVLTGAVSGVTATGSFVTGSRGADVLRVTSLPSGVVYAGVAAGLPLIVQAMLSDGVTPDGGAQVTVTAVGAGLGGCGGLASCVLTADGAGLVATTVIPAAAGVVSMQAAAGGGRVSASFGAVAMPVDVLRVVSAPANGAVMGVVAGTSFQVRVFLGDGVTVGAGASVTLTAAGAALGACGGGASCVVKADGAGMVASAVTPAVAAGLTGMVTVVAAAGGGSVQMSFTTVAPAPDRLEVMSVPMNGGLAGTMAAGMFRVRLVKGDGVTPVVGMAVTLSATGGVLGACGGAVCGLVTDPAGTVGTSVTASAGGMVGLVAMAEGLSLATSFMAVADSLRLVAVPVGPNYVGVQTAPVTMQVLGPDGVTPVAGASVTVTASLGTLVACGLPVCVLTADGQGVVSTALLPVAAGVVTIRGAAGGGVVETGVAVLTAPPDILRVVSVPLAPVYAKVTAAKTYTLLVLKGDGVTPDAGAAVVLQSSQAMLQNRFCFVSCAFTADANGMVTATVYPLLSGTTLIQATVGGVLSIVKFAVATLPPNRLTVVSAPADGAIVGRAAGTPFAVRLMLGDGLTPVAKTVVTLTATGGTLGACGTASCPMATDAIGMVSATVTPAAAGVVTLAASVGSAGATASFTAVVPPDVLTVVSGPANGAMVGQAAGVPFAVKVMLGDGVTAAVGASVTLTSVGGVLGCGASTCVVAVGASGVVSSVVTPTVAGSVMLTAAAGGGTARASFVAVAPDVVSVVSTPVDGALLGQAAGVPFAVKVMLGDGVTAAVGAMATLTAVGGVLGCGASSCVVAVGASGVVSSVVTPMVAGSVVLTAAAGGGTAAASFMAVVPPDVLTVVSAPAGGARVGSPAEVPFVVKTVLWNGLAARGVVVTLTASGGTLGACGAVSCVLTADAEGMVSTTVTPMGMGIVRLTAAGGGGSVGASFMASVLPPDVLTVKAVPVSGGYAGRVAGGVFQVAVVAWDGSAAAGVAVTVAASNGTLGACGLAMCVLVADASGVVATAVTPVAAGLVGLTAMAGGGSVGGSFTAVAMPPDGVTLVSVPANGAYVGAVATGSFAVRVVLGDGTVGAGVPVTLTVSGGVLGACGGLSCVLVADGAGMVSTTVTASVVGSVGLMATAGGGSVSGAFTAVITPVDVLTVMSMPGNGAYVGDVAAAPVRVRVMLGDGAVGAGVAVTLTAAGGVLGACGAVSCVVVADGVGMVSTTVTPVAAGMVGVRASAGGGSVAASFTAVEHVRAVTMVRAVEYVAAGAVVQWAPRAVMTLDGVVVAEALQWTGGAGMVVQGSWVVVGPLGRGGVASGTVCAWGNVCAGFSAAVVDEVAWGIVEVSGGGQVAAVGGTFDPVVARVVDGAGHPVAGVAVTVGQVVRGYVDCSGAGRCPVGAVLGSGNSTVVSDGDGLVAVVPLVTAGVGETTGVVLTAGEGGFLSIGLSMVP